MAQDILRNEDFKTTATFDNVRGIIYKGNGSPVGRADSANPGAIYIDNYTGQLWVALTAGDPATWRPYFSDVTNNVRIDSDVQDGDLIGIFGAGAWTVGSSMSVSKNGIGSAGTQNAAFAAGGQLTGYRTDTSLYNGSIWSASGNLNVSKYYPAGIGAQNAGAVIGGSTAVGPISSTEQFNGTTWTSSANLNGPKIFPGSVGSTAATLAAGGGTATAVIGATEIFNGSAWSVAASLNASRQYAPNHGAQNACLISAGCTGTTVASTIAATTERFNGSSWSFGPAILQKRYAQMSFGSENAGLMTGGDTNGGTGATVLSEIFNGSSWASTGALSLKVNTAASAGSQAAGFIAGGYNGTNFQVRTELHNQTIYRKLTYNSSQCALNIGMAYNVTTTSLTASVMRGDLPSTYIAGNKVSGADGNNSVYFGISRFNNVDNNVFVSSATATISSISVSTTHNATLNLSVSINTGFAVGGLLLISGGGSSTKTVIVGGTASAPIVRWENVSSSASTSLTVGCLWGQRIVYDSVGIIAAGTVAYITQSDSTAISDFYKGRYGDTLYIPYANVSGTNGSSQIAGTYKIALAEVSGGLVTYTIDLPTAMNFTETGIGKVTLLQQLVTSALSQGLGGITGRAFSADDIILGYRNKMRIPMNPFQDDLSNGRF